MSKRSRRRRKRRRPRPVRFLSTRWFRSALAVMDTHDGFDYDGRTITPGTPKENTMIPPDEDEIEFEDIEFSDIDAMERAACFESLAALAVLALITVIYVWLRR